MSDQQHLSQFTLKDLPKKNIIYIKETESVPNAFKKLFNHRISSAPVVDDKGHLLGCIDMVDIVFFVINICQTSQDLAKYLNLGQEATSNVFEDFSGIKNFLSTDEVLSENYSLDEAKFLTNYSRRNVLTVLPPTTSFLEVAKELCEKHRVAIGDNELQDYITQSEVVRFLSKKNSLGPCGTETIDKLGLATKEIISIRDNQKAIEAYKILALKKISCVAVVNSEGNLVGQISTSDIKSISNTGEIIDTLFKGFNEYKEILRNKYAAPLNLVTVNPQSTLQEAVEKMSVNKVHRVWVLEGVKLLGVVSYSDIIKKTVGV